MDDLRELLHLQEEHNQLLYNIDRQKNEISSILERLQFVSVTEAEHIKALDKLRMTREEVSKLEFEARRLENYIKRVEMGIMFDVAE